MLGRGAEALDRGVWRSAVESGGLRVPALRVVPTVSGVALAHARWPFRISVVTADPHQPPVPLPLPAPMCAVAAAARGADGAHDAGCGACTEDRSAAIQPQRTTDRTCPFASLTVYPSDFLPPPPPSPAVLALQSLQLRPGSLVWAVVMEHCDMVRGPQGT